MPKSGKSDDEVTAQQLAERSGESYHTIDHWAGLELLKFRRRGRKRLFLAKQSLERCQEIRTLQDAGHNLLTIRGMLSNNK